jgi:hypothetical protein
MTTDSLCSGEGVAVFAPEIDPQIAQSFAETAKSASIGEICGYSL